MQHFAGEPIVSETHNQLSANNTKNTDVTDTNTDVKAMQDECVDYRLVDDVTCKAYVQSRGHFVCYSPTIFSQCCKTQISRHKTYSGKEETTLSNHRPGLRGRAGRDGDKHIPKELKRTTWSMQNSVMHVQIENT